MTEIPQNVQSKLKEIRDSGDIEFAEMAETVIKYYISKMDELQEDPSYVVDYLSDLLEDVDIGLIEDDNL